MGHERRDVVAVGLTGGIGAGKSTALAVFGELGALTVSADELVHRLYAKPGVIAEVAARFGPGVLGPDGAVDRRRLAEQVRGNEAELRWLENLTHPRVASAIRRFVRTAPSGTVVVAEVPLLCEAGLAGLFDLIVTIEAHGETRRRRSTHGFDRDQFSELESLQASTKSRVEASDLAFYNDGGLDELRHFVRAVYERASARLEEKP